MWGIKLHHAKTGFHHAKSHVSPRAAKNYTFCILYLNNQSTNNIMKKRIALQDTKEWCFDHLEPEVYFNDRKVYPEVKSLTIFQFKEIELGLEFDISKISLPNLEEIMLIIVIDDGGSYDPSHFFSKLQPDSYSKVKSIGLLNYNDILDYQPWTTKCLNLESIEFNIPKNVDLPMELTKAENIIRLRISESSLSKIPDEVFSLRKLERLDLDRSSKITVIPDEIKNLSMLKTFSLWSSNFSYVSPELFKLPYLEELNLAYTSYKNPTEELFEAIKQLKQKKPDFYNGFIERVHWLREIWEQA
jgi:hypothetical protein